MRTRLPLLVLLLAVSFLSASAQHFSSFFRDSTLRLDYILPRPERQRPALRP